jgi:hypothetical protein
MKNKLLLCLALVLSGLFCFTVVAQDVTTTTKWIGFPSFPPLTNINPSVTHPVSVRVPTKLKIERTADMLSVTISTNGFESTNLMVGTNMVTGVESELYIYPTGELRPTNCMVMGLGGLDFYQGKSFWHTKPDGIPQAGKTYIVEMDLKAFETDIPSQHMWMPWGKNYKVLWRRTLKEIIKP